MAGEKVLVRLSEDEKRRFRVAAARRDTSMSALGSELLREWLDENAEEQTTD
jgi:plasmid stability protein